MPDEYPRVRLAAAQSAPVWLDRDATVEKACGIIREAGANGADILGFPENYIPGHPVWFYFHPATSRKSMDLSVDLFKNSVEIPGPATAALCKAAAEAHVFVVIGMTEKAPNTTGTLYNSLLFIDRAGRIVGKHQKLVPTIGERLVHAGGAGDCQGTVASEFGPVSGLCCGENSNPFALALLAAEYTRIHIASWPNHFIPDYCGMCESSLLASRSFAYMAKCFVISACGTNSPEMQEVLPATVTDRAFLSDGGKTGGSAIVNPRGEVIAGPLAGNQEGVLYADADLEDALRGRMVHDVGGHYNRSDIFQLHVNRARPALLLYEDGTDAARADVGMQRLDSVPGSEPETGRQHLREFD